MSEAERHRARRLGAGWFDTNYVAGELGGCSESHVRRLVEQRHLQAFNAARPGARRADWRFRQEWIDAYKAKQMSMPQETHGAA